MGRETTSERRRRSHSPTDRYGRRATNRERSSEREAMPREHDRNGYRGSSSFRGREEERGRQHRHDDRDHDRYLEDRQHGRSRRQSDDRARDESPSARVVGTRKDDSPHTQSRASRWGNAGRSSDASYHANGFEDHKFEAGERNSGTYGPADRGWGVSRGGGKGSGTSRDESWVEHRLQLRMEARPPRGVWNTSPSPPRKKETKVSRAALEDARKAESKDQRKQERRKRATRRVSGSKSAKKGDKRRSRRHRSPSLTSSASDSSSSSSSSSSDSSSSNNSSSSSDSSSSDSSSSDSDSSREEELDARQASNKSKKRASSPDDTEHGKPKLARPASPASPVPEMREIGVIAAGNGTRPGVPPRAELDELDELDAEEAARFKADVQGHRHHETKDSDDEAGPMPVPQLDDLQGEGDRGVNYGGALLPGEGAAIAQFVQKGLRIPRRGEVGWAGQEIEKLEDSGYVMSGSRHARMNAVRLRKENQVFNAEERRALALIMFEEKQQKENEILGNFRQMLTESNREGEKKGEGGSTA